MRKSLAGGLFWRWNRLLVKLGEAKAIFFVVGIFVLYRWALLASEDFGLPAVVETVLMAVYLGFVVYTLSAGAIVRSMIAKEVAKVRLNPGF
jgi:hypothetical protein